MEIAGLVLVLLLLAVLVSAAICARMQYDCEQRIARALLVWREEMLALVEERWMSAGFADELWRRILRRHVPEMLETVRRLSLALSSDGRTMRAAGKITKAAGALSLDERGQKVLAEEISAAVDSRNRSLPERL